MDSSLKITSVLLKTRWVKLIYPVFVSLHNKLNTIHCRHQSPKGLFHTLVSKSGVYPHCPGLHELCLELWILMQISTECLQSGQLNLTEICLELNFPTLAQSADSVQLAVVQLSSAQQCEINSNASCLSCGAAAWHDFIFYFRSHWFTEGEWRKEEKEERG